MKIIIYITLGILASYNISLSQPVEWQRVFDYNGQKAVGRDILQTFDGGYIICGAIVNPVRIYLIKLNYLGNKEWENIISDSSGIVLYANSIQQTSDSGYVMTGYNGVDLCIIRADKNGNLEWKKRFNHPGAEARGSSIRVTDYGGIIVCGDLFDFTTEKGYVIKTDSLGNLQWEHVYGDSIENIGYDILQINNNYYLTGSSAPNFSENINGYLYKIDLNGNIVWIRNFPQYQATTRLLKINSGNIILAGIGHPQGIFFAKVDTSGNIFFQQVIPTLNPEFYFSSMCLNHFQNIIVAGIERYPQITGTDDFSAGIVDTNGNLLFQRRLDTPHEFEDICYSVSPTSDNGFIFVGDTEFMSIPGNEDRILGVKTDSLFNTVPVVNILNQIQVTPSKFILFQNYPNPFNSTTVIKYQLERSAYVSLRLNDVLGRELMSFVNGVQLKGTFFLTIDGNSLSGGCYYLRFLIDGNLVDSKKIFLLK